MKLLPYIFTLLLSSQIAAQTDHDFSGSQPNDDSPESLVAYDSLYLFPHTSLDKLILEGNLPLNAHLSLLSSGGRELIELFSKKVAKNRYRLFATRTELDLLSPGLYYVCIEESKTHIIPWFKG